MPAYVVILLEVRISKIVHGLFFTLLGVCPHIIDLLLSPSSPKVWDPSPSPTLILSSGPRTHHRRYSARTLHTPHTVRSLFNQLHLVANLINVCHHARYIELHLVRGMPLTRCHDNQFMLFVMRLVSPATMEQPLIVPSLIPSSYNLNQRNELQNRMRESA